MKPVYFCLTGAFVLTGILSFGSGEQKISATAAPAVGLTAYSAFDSVPNKTSYLDLNTGESIDIWYDAVGKRTLNKKTGATVEFYVNQNTNDTVFGRGKFVVNGYVVKGGDGKWKLNDEKVKVEGDELKVKVGEQKLKIDGDEIKIKANGVKAKSEDGEIKDKTKDGAKAKYEK